MVNPSRCSVRCVSTECQLKECIIYKLLKGRNGIYILIWINMFENTFWKVYLGRLYLFWWVPFGNRIQAEVNCRHAWRNRIGYLLCEWFEKYICVQWPSFVQFAVFCFFNQKKSYTQNCTWTFGGGGMDGLCVMTQSVAPTPTPYTHTCKYILYMYFGTEICRPVYSNHLSITATFCVSLE